MFVDCLNIAKCVRLAFPALVEPVGRLATASAEPGCVQGLTAREQRRDVGGAPS